MSPSQELDEFVGPALARFQEDWVGATDTFEYQMGWQQVLATRGWVAPAWAVEHGGKGLTPSERIACEQVLINHRAPMIASTLGVKNVGPTIAHWGTPEQKEHLPRILDGSEIWCQGFSEPDFGSDLAGLRMRADRDGDDYVINGEKIWTSAGLRATHCQLLVRTDPDAAKHKGISALLIPLDLPGLERRPIRQMNGQEGFASLLFSEVRVPVSSLIGPENQGWQVTMTTLAHERSGIAMFATRLEDETMELVEAVRESGLGDKVMRQEIVRRYIDGRILGLTGRKILTALSAGVEPGPEQSIIKLSWSQAGQRLAETRFALDGMGAQAGEELTASNKFLLSRSTTIAAGTTEVMKNIVGERVLGLPREPRP